MPNRVERPATAQNSPGTERAQPGIGLGETLQLLRDEIVNSMTAAAGQPVRFRIDSVDVELKFTVTNTVGADGGVKFWVVTAQGKASRESSAEHTVTLHLSTLTSSGGEVLTGDALETIPR